MSTLQRKYKNDIFMYCKNIFRETVINVSSDQIEMQISGSFFTGKKSLYKLQNKILQQAKTTSDSNLRPPQCTTLSSFVLA